YVASNLFYYKALFVEEISRVLPLYSITPIFVLILSTIFLGEVFTPVKYLGIALIILGSILISLKKKERLTLSGALLLILVASLFLSVYYVALKHITDVIPFWDAFVWTRIGCGLTIPFLVGFLYRPIKETLKRTPRGTLYVCANEGLNVLGVLFFVIATSVGFISLVSALSEAQPLFLLFLASLVSFYRPQILQEELRRSVIALKLIAIALIIFGAILII
ncbi:MAG: EamA family transporter, partial [Candidatus Zixiibacteriota bacterium]